jgi:hypothetical protein
MVDIGVRNCRTSAPLVPVSVLFPDATGAVAYNACFQTHSQDPVHAAPSAACAIAEFGGDLGDDSKTEVGEISTVLAQEESEDWEAAESGYVQLPASC